MTWRGHWLARCGVALLALALFASACGGEDDATSAVDDATEASGDSGAIDGGSDEDSALEESAIDSGSDDSDEAMAEEEAEEEPADAPSADAREDLEPLQALDEDPELVEVVQAIASGFGDLSRAQERAIQGAAESGAICDNAAGPRAAPRISEVEVEIVTVIKGCLQFSYDVAGFRSLLDDLQALRNDPDVLAASPLLLDYHLNQIESDWPLDTIGGSSLTEPDDPTGDSVVIAIIDSGIDALHPALAGVTIRRAPDSGSGDYVPTGHGTVAAAIVTAPMGASERGLAPAVELLDVPADLCAPGECGCDPCAPMTPAEAIRWSTDNGADIISMSFGYHPSPKPAWWQILLDENRAPSTTETIAAAIAYADASGTAMAAAAGNCANAPTQRCVALDQFEIPAGHDSVIGVAATESDEDGVAVPASYSTRQSYVELAAPGSLLVTGPDDEPIAKRGTSYATPFVAASLAILIGQDGPLADQPDKLDVARQILFKTATDLDPVGRDSQTGYGQIDVQAALETAAAYAAEHPVVPKSE